MVLGAVSVAQFILFVIAVLALGGFLVGVSEAGGLTMGKALIVAVVAGLVGFLVTVFVADLILSALRIPSA